MTISYGSVSCKLKVYFETEHIILCKQVGFYLKEILMYSIVYMY